MNKELKEKRKATNISLTFENREDIVGLATKQEFRDFILVDCLAGIKEAVEENMEKVELFNILNMSLIVELEKPNYKKVLKRIIQYYQNSEEYEKCAEIQTLIGKL